MIIAYLILLTLTGSIGDGLNNSGKQKTGHLLKALEILMAFSYCFLFNMVEWDLFLISLGAYTAFRVAIFDIVYNVAAGNEWTYMGGDNFWDKWLVKVNPSGLLFIRIIFLTLAVSLVIKEL